MKGAMFGPRLKAAREGAGLSMRALCGLSGVTVATICNIETGKTGAHVGTVKRLADALGLTVADLLGENIGPDVITLRLSPATRAHLDRLHATGLHGVTVEDAAMQFFLHGLRYELAHWSPGGRGEAE